MTDIERWKEQAKKGDVVAMLKVGCCYDLGIGVERDEEKADFWLGTARDERSELRARRMREGKIK